MHGRKNSSSEVRDVSETRLLYLCEHKHVRSPICVPHSGLAGVDLLLLLQTATCLNQSLSGFTRLELTVNKDHGELR